MEEEGARVKEGGDRMAEEDGRCGVGEEGKGTQVEMDCRVVGVGGEGE